MSTSSEVSTKEKRTGAAQSGLKGLMKENDVPAFFRLTTEARSADLRLQQARWAAASAMLQRYASSILHPQLPDNFAGESS